MAIVAIAEYQDGYVVPIPFDLIPSQIQGNELIIVAIDDIPASRALLSSVYSYYGAENCQILMGKIPQLDEEKSVICITARCLVNKSQDLDGKSPPANISPLWTKDKFGIDLSEALVLDCKSREMMTDIQDTMSAIRSQLDDLKIKIDKRSLDTITNCERIIKQATDELAKTKSDCRWFAAESVAKFMRDKFNVDAWVDILVEPAVLFCVNQESDEEAIVIGSSIEGVMNEIEPDNADRFFDEYVYDASVFPIVMDVSFVDGKRITNRKEYYQASGGQS